MGRRRSPPASNNRFARLLFRQRADSSSVVRQDDIVVESSSRSWSPGDREEYDDDDERYISTSSLSSEIRNNNSEPRMGTDDGTSSGNSSNGEKNVRFGQCSIRRYSQVMGEHPCCPVGCPLELGWEYETVEEQLPVDAYEASPHTHQQLTRLSYEERREILQGKYSDGEFRRASRRLNRERITRSRCHQKGMNEFFSSPSPITIEATPSS